MLSRGFLNMDMNIQFLFFFHIQKLILLSGIILRSDRVDPSAGDNEAIRRAFKNGHDKVVALLLKDPRVDPSANNNEAIKWASFNGHDKVVVLLLKDPRVANASFC